MDLPTYVLELNMVLYLLMLTMLIGRKTRVVIAFYVDQLFLNQVSKFFFMSVVSNSSLQLSW